MFVAVHVLAVICFNAHIESTAHRILSLSWMSNGSFCRKHDARCVSDSMADVMISMLVTICERSEGSDARFEVVVKLGTITQIGCYF